MRPTSAHSGLRGPPLSLCDIMQRGYLQQVRMLVDLGSNLEARDATGRTPLMLTAYVQPEDWGVGIARLLIECGVNMAARDRFGMNVLHHACIYERVELARVLLNALDFDMVQVDKFGNTPLHYAAVSGNVPLIKLLLTYLLRYKLPLDKVNKNNRTAMDEANYNGNDVCAAIINAAINYSKESGKDDNQTIAKGDNDSVIEGNAPFMTSSEYSYCPPEISVKISGETSKHSKPTGEEQSRTTFQKVDLMKEDIFFQQADDKENKDISPLSSDRSSLSRARRTGIRRPHTAVIKPPIPTAPSSQVSGGLAPSSQVNGGLAPSSQGSGGLAPSSEVNGDLAPSAKLSGELAPSSQLSSGRSESKWVKRPLSAASSSSSGSTGMRLPKSSLQNLQNNDSNVQLQGIALADNASDTQLSSGRKLSARTSQSQRKLRRESSIIYRAPSRQPLMPYEKNPEQVIHVASENDFRNTPEYVLKLTRMYYDPATFDTDALPVLIQRPPSVVRYDDQGDKKTTPNWRDEMRFLYRHYEIQCSPSWRNAAKPPPDPLSNIQLGSPCGTQGEESEEIGSARDSKKGRRISSSQRPEISTSSASVKRRPTSNKQRKISTTSPPVAPNRAAGASPDHGMADVGMASSSESLSSATSAAKKKDSVGNRTDPSQAGGGGGGAGGAATNSSTSSRKDAKNSLDNTSNGRGSGSESGSVIGVRSGGVSLSANSAASNSGSGGNSNSVSGGSGTGAAQARGGRRTGTSNSYTVPVLTETFVDGDDQNQGADNSEPSEVDSNRLSVIDEDL